ncbi:DUF4440 domain-containing protein [Sphingomicrobium lutaoense]|uniref:DUF4440 domain-containing protein n=1 Tax=Sphingomicrobium lutaoense TaxID=515949 RepID=A0A839Z4H6_9SPHN|nr:DUF4440 domain-containing protein [Sphingomicrobium lutaoense]MBB3764525.1 hypothetical protein [Sphingomicrobium lutaoense]
MISLALALAAAAVKCDMPPQPEVVQRIEDRDAELFHFAFEGCNAAALEELVHPDFRMLHDLEGLVLPTGAAFLKSVADQCARRAPGGESAGYRNRRLLTPGTRVVRRLGDWGALEEGTHSFFEWEDGEWVQRGGARYMHVWKWMRTENRFRLFESISYDHGAAIPYPRR